MNSQKHVSETFSEYYASSVTQSLFRITDGHISLYPQTALPLRTSFLICSKITLTETPTDTQFCVQDTKLNSLGAVSPVAYDSDRFSLRLQVPLSKHLPEFPLPVLFYSRNEIRMNRRVSRNAPNPLGLSGDKVDALTSILRCHMSMLRLDSWSVATGD